MCRLDERGFTLIEVLVVVVIVSIVTATIAHALPFWFGVGMKTQAQMNTQRNLEFALNWIIEGGSQQPGLIAATSVSITPSSPDPLTGSVRLDYTRPDNGAIVTYYWDRTEQALYKGSDTDREVLLTGVSLFNAQLNSSGSSDVVTLTIQSQINGVAGPRTLTLSASVKLRNKS